MRHNGIRLLVICAIIASVGIMVYAQTHSRKLNTVPFCDLMDSSKQPEDTLVRTEAYMTYSTIGRVDGGDPFLYSPSCNNKDNFVVAEFVKELDRKTKDFFAKLAAEKTFRLKLTLTGKLQKSFLPVYGHLSWSQKKFEIASIISVEDATISTVSPDFDAKSPLLDSAFRLRQTNDILILYFINGRIDDGSEDIIDGNFVLTDLAGDTIGFGELPNFVSSKFAELKRDNKAILVRQPIVTIRGNEYVATGIITFDSGNRNTQVEYRNTFRRDKDSFIATRTEFRRLTER